MNDLRERLAPLIALHFSALAFPDMVKSENHTKEEILEFAIDLCQRIVTTMEWEMDQLYEEQQFSEKNLKEVICQIGDEIRSAVIQKTGGLQ